MKETESIPIASNLVESMRSLGYSFKTAIADIIDNSISANAKKIELFLTPKNDPELIVFDNGCGMSEKELKEALRYGSRNPSEERAETDLGRFGLGLKSASLSQCRKLTVVSKMNHMLHGFSWDFDVIIKKNDWVLLQYEKEELEKLPLIDLFDNVETGTYVLLQKFDKILDTTTNIEKVIAEQMAITKEHLSLVFHRFLEGSIKIFVNNDEIIPLDPFLVNHNATQILREQSFEIKESKVIVQPYILPIKTKLSLQDIKKVGGETDLRNNQGFYIYRNKRLITWGTWFNQIGKEELSKLARVKVDIPNSLDDIWSIDIKKSSASLPDIIKKNLRSCIQESVLKSKKVHNYRRRANRNEDINYIWNKIELRDNFIEYEINRELPQIDILKKQLNGEQIKLLDLLIDNIERSLPKYDIYCDYAEKKVKNKQNNDEVFSDVAIKNMYEEIKIQLEECNLLKLDKEKILKALLKTEPYCNYEKLATLFSEENNQNE